jgi:hypothetical protein
MLKTFFTSEVGEMPIDEMCAWERVQDLCISSWTIIEKYELTKVKLGTKETTQHVKVNVSLKLVISMQLVELLKEFKDIFT